MKSETNQIHIQSSNLSPALAKKNQFKQKANLLHYSVLNSFCLFVFANTNTQYTKFMFLS